MSQLDAVELDGIAVVGLSGRFPGAPTVETLWEHLRDGVESITVFDDDQMRAVGIDPDEARRHGYVPAAGIIDDIDRFDARFFGFSPRDAEILDPQQRLFLECAWEALERAGCNPRTFPGPIGVFAGTSLSTYALHNLYPITGMPGGLDDFQVFLSNDKDHLATRTSYKLNLRGPSVTVQTACSTSLVAVCLACDSLQALQCDVALAGGVTVRVPQHQGYVYKEGGIGSPDGHCRPFDAEARGTVGSSGVAVVALKRLSDARADGDPVHAVIRGWALNNDGSSKVGYTAPSVSGQAAVIAAAQALADVGSETISYVETHGTATPIGDPIEVAALMQAFGRTPLPRGSCAIGSLKSNLGHLDSAAGAAALIKTVLALEHRMLPPSLHYTRPNPQIDFDAGPFYVNDTLQPWDTTRLPRRAGVSSFGIGGTNAHVVVEEAPERAPSDPACGTIRLLLSAQTPAALDRMVSRLGTHLADHPESNLADVAYTLETGRVAWPHRRAWLCRDTADAVACLTAGSGPRARDGVVDVAARPLVFLLPGQGAQHVDMARDLYRTEPLVARHVDAGAEQLRDVLGFDIREVIFPETAARDAAAERLTSTAVAQPALFIIEYALARMWMHWGLQPSALVGHSLGEYVAACLAGVFTFEDALHLVACRGRLMQAMPRGAMLAVALAPTDVPASLDDDLSLAAINAPHLSVVSGSTDAIDALERRCSDRGVAVRRLRTSHAFHSAMMDPVVEALADEVRRVPARPPAIALISNVTGRWLTNDQAVDPEYWARQMRATVRFADGLRHVRESGTSTLLEVGPGRTLSSLARGNAGAPRSEAVLTSLPDADASLPIDEHLSATLADLWLSGVSIDWYAVHERERRRRVTLPTYPFERERYWIDGGAAARSAATSTASVPDATTAQPLSQWFSVPSWTRKVRPPHPPVATSGTWLILADAHGIGSELAGQLQALGASTRVVPLDAGLAASNGHGPRALDRTFYADLLAEVDADGSQPPRLVHLWSLSGTDTAPAAAHVLSTGLYSLVALAQAVVARYPGRAVQIDVVTDRVHRVVGDERIVPLKRSMVAVCTGVPQEYPQVRCRLIELDSAAGVRIDDLVAEVADVSGPAQVAVRGVHRWSPHFESCSLTRERTSSRLRQGGVYVITGGLGRIGLALARHLAAEWRARLVLVARGGLPDRAEWADRVADAPADDRVASRIRGVLSVEEAGGEVVVMDADVTDIDAMRQVLADARERFGAVHGVVHGAGLTSADGFATTSEIDLLLMERQLGPKAGGALVLAELLRGGDIDFVVLLSSLSSVLVGLGFIPYAAANLVLDAVAEQESAAGRGHWISINWDGWDLSGSAENAIDTAGGGMVIRAGEGCEAFERILAAWPQPQIVVSTTDLAARMRAWVDVAGLAGDHAAPEVEEGAPRHARPQLPVAYAAPRSAIERDIAEIWQSLLGVSQIGIDDNFFELGGHSLLAIQLTSRVREIFHVDVPVRALFDAPTIAALAALVESGRATAVAADERIVRVLERVERLSDDEMRALLASQARRPESPS